MELLLNVIILNVLLVLDQQQTALSHVTKAVLNVMLQICAKKVSQDIMSPQQEKFKLAISHVLPVKMMIPTVLYPVTQVFVEAVIPMETV
jgi:hypothetical protein